MEHPTLAPNNDKHLWVAQLFLGFLTILNILLATFMLPDYLWFEHNKFDHIHFATIIILFAGLAPFVLPKQCVRSEIAIVTINIISMSICVVYIFVNIVFWIMFALQSPKPKNGIFHFMLIYKCIDLLISVLSICISYKMLKKRVQISEKLPIQNSEKIYAAGIVYLVTTIIGIINHSIETFSIGNANLRQITGTTVSEMSVIFMNLVCSILTVHSTSIDNYLIHTSVLLMSGTLLIPSMLYTFIDFRLITTYHRIFPNDSLMTLSFLIFFFLIAISRFVSGFVVFSLFTISITSNHTLIISNIHRMIFKIFATIFLVIGALLISLATIHVFIKRQNAYLYEIDEKIAVLLAIIVVFSFLAPNSDKHFIPLAITLSSSLSLLLYILSTSLSDALYYYLENVSLFLLKSSLFEELETGCKISVASALLIFTMFIIYFIRKNMNSENTDDSNDKNAKHIMIIGFILTVITVVFFPLNLLFLHPLILVSEAFKLSAIYYMYRTYICIIFNAVTQMILSNFLTKGPLVPSIMLVNSIENFYTIIVMLDNPIHRFYACALTLHTVVELLLLFGYVANIVILLKILRETNSDNLRYGVENPLVEMEETNRFKQ